MTSPGKMVLPGACCAGWWYAMEYCVCRDDMCHVYWKFMSDIAKCSQLVVST